MKYRGTVVSILVLSVLSGYCLAGEEAQSDQREIFQDELLDKLTGDWRMVGHFHGDASEYSLRASWVLRHQFMFLEMKDISDPPQYEAMIFIGYDVNVDRYVVHWLDEFGANASSPVGRGNKNNNTIVLNFDDPRQGFRDTLTYDADSKTWRFLIESESDSGEWEVFADYQVVR